jgi:nucleoside-diphosphate-sugar epimerase
MIKKVLVTGMSGLIGGLLKDHLIDKEDYELASLNRSYVEGVTNFQADISDLKAIEPAFIGQDVVVHLAAYLGSQDWEGQHAGNVLGTYNVFEAARRAGVKRVVFASSGNAIRGFERISPYREISEGKYDEVPADYPMITHEQIRPEALYGAAKVWGEALGRHFSDEYGMSVICVRIGSVHKENKPLSIRENAIYLGHRDICQMLNLCIDGPEDIKYDVVFAVSNNKWNYRDISHAKDLLGYSPVDSADDNFFS